MSIFKSYEEAYSKLMMDLTELCIKAIKLVISANDETENLFVSGGFARNPIFIHLLKLNLPEKKGLVSEIDNSVALGAALVIADIFPDSDVSQLNLGIIK